MAKTIRYPRKDLSFEEAFGQEMLDRQTSLIFSWQQGPGVFGTLCLHACWSEIGVLKNRYQGQTISLYYPLIRGAMELFDRTGNIRWRRLANDIASNILFLQCEDGGFRHASAEFEPSYVSGKSCPIHQCQPILALLDYASWHYADETLKALIKPAVDRHWEWFNNHFWRRGNGWKSPLPFDAWCGVTNQDLVAVAALSAYGRLYGDFSRYENWGKKVLDTYLSPVYYHRAIGLFERGDNPNFAERSPYYEVVMNMLERIHADTGDERIPPVIDNVALHLFDAAFTGPDGMTHLAWGAETDPDDKSRVLGWIKTPVVSGGYPGLIDHMEKALARHPDGEKQAVLDSLKATLASYAFSDGSIPASLWPKDPILELAASSNSSFWWWLINRIGPTVKDPSPVPAFCLHRQLGDAVWKTKGKLWAMENGGRRLFGGYKPASHGVTHGPEEEPADGSFEELNEYDILEILPELVGE